MKRLAFPLLRFSLAPALLRHFAQRRRVTILTYHDPSPEVAARHLSALGRVYSLISLKEYLEKVSRGRANELPDRALVITFDDGHRGNYRLLPVIRGLGIRPTIFLCSGLVGTKRPFWFLAGLSEEQRESLKHMEDSRRLDCLSRTRSPQKAGRQALNWPEIEEMRPHFDFQAHSVTHPVLPRCGEGKAKREVGDCKRQLEERLGEAVEVFSYPNGDYTDRELRIVREAGFRAAVTAEAGYNDAGRDLFELRRIPMRDAGGVSEALVRASGLWELLRNWLKRPAQEDELSARSRTRSQPART